MDEKEGQTVQERGIVLDGTVGESEPKKGFNLTEKEYRKIAKSFFTSIYWSPFQILLRGHNWKKRGYKGRVEVWKCPPSKKKDEFKGKFISAHKTIQQALDSIPSEKEARNGDKKKRRGDKISD